MFFVPSITIKVSREDEGTDAYGDSVTTKTQILSGIGAHIYERTVTAAEPTSGRVLTTRVLKAILMEKYGIRPGDIIEDSAGLIYTVTEVLNFYNPFDEAHTELTLRSLS